MEREYLSQGDYFQIDGKLRWGEVDRVYYDESGRLIVRFWRRKPVMGRHGPAAQQVLGKRTITFERVQKVAEIPLVPHTGTYEEWQDTYWWHERSWAGRCEDLRKQYKASRLHGECKRKRDPHFKNYAHDYGRYVPEDERPKIDHGAYHAAEAAEYKADWQAALNDPDMDAESVALLEKRYRDQQCYVDFHNRWKDWKPPPELPRDESKPTSATVLFVPKAKAKAA